MIDPLYAPLRDFLVTRPQASLLLGFAEVERILGRALPPAARRRRAWWANDQAHCQALAWLVAGWRVEFVDLSDELVHFARLPA